MAARAFADGLVGACLEPRGRRTPRISGWRGRKCSIWHIPAEVHGRYFGTLKETKKRTFRSRRVDSGSGTRGLMGDEWPYIAGFSFRSEFPGAVSKRTPGFPFLMDLRSSGTVCSLFSIVAGCDGYHRLGNPSAL